MMIAPRQGCEDPLADHPEFIELRHDLKWGGGPSLRRPPKKEDILFGGSITFEGTSIPEKDLLEKLTKSGKPFNSYRMNQDTRALRQFLAGGDFLTADIRAVRQTQDRKVDALFTVNRNSRSCRRMGQELTPAMLCYDAPASWSFAKISSAFSACSAAHLRNLGGEFTAEAHRI